MALTKLGRVKSGKGKSYEVFWDSSDKLVYVGWAGRTKIGRANSSSDAMRKSEAWLYDK